MTFEAELGYAVARGWLTPPLADVAILARVKDIDEAREAAVEVRRSADIWLHVRDQLKVRIRDLTWSNVDRREPRNVILAQAHEVNREQVLSEQEVNETVLEVVWASLRDGTRRRRHAR